MIEVEKYNAIDKLSQSKRERYWLEFYQATLNKITPPQTESEYRKKYREVYRNPPPLPPPLLSLLLLKRLRVSAYPY